MALFLARRNPHSFPPKSGIFSAVVQAPKNDPSLNNNPAGLLRTLVLLSPYSPQKHTVEINQAAKKFWGKEVGDELTLRFLGRNQGWYTITPTITGIIQDTWRQPHIVLSYPIIAPHFDFLSPRAASIPSHYKAYDPSQANVLRVKQGKAASSNCNRGPQPPILPGTP